MKLLIYVMWFLLAIAGGEAIYGIIKRSRFLIAVGLIVAVMCALGLLLAVGYADSIHLTGKGILV